jgi:hypothetical protein
MTYKFNLTFLAVACLIAAFTIPASAQSTIFNIPTTDVVAKKKTYLEFDFVSHLESNKNGGFQTYVPRAVFGVGGNVEVGVNVAATRSAAPAIVYIQPNIKWQFYNNADSGTALSVGAIAYTPLKDRSAIDSFGLLYGNVSKKFKGDHGARLTFGGYGLTDYDSSGPNGKKATKGGVIVGYEQPLNSKVSFVTDWFSGNNALGYVTPGFSIALPKSGLLNIGYSVGNKAKKNNGLFVYYGITF